MPTVDQQKLVRLPPDIQLGDLIGEGQRSDVYAALTGGERAVVKVYRADAIHKYRTRYGVSIARFEYERNCSFYNVSALRPYIARPIQAFGATDGYSEAFIQEFVAGRRLHGLARETGIVPAEIIVKVREIIEAATAAGLFDIDLCAKNIMLQQRESGWHPMLFDFNLMPQYLHAPNPFVSLLYLTGLRKKSFRDYRHLANLENWQAARARRAV